MARIAVIDDEQGVCHAFQAFLSSDGHEVAVAATAQRGMELVARFQPDLVILDVRLPDGDGLDVLAGLVAQPDPPAVLVITAHGTMETAVEAMRRGAFDYLTKPIDLDEAQLVIDRALRTRDLSQEVVRLRKEVRGGAPLLVGNSLPMQRVYKTIGAVAAADSIVLIRGESGTGKELVARAIHQAGPRAKGPFVTVDCTALPENLVESELYGHEAGAFTGATAAKPGRIEQAQGGTLFLDEIAELSQSAQAKLLRFLESHETERLGSNRTIHLDVRVLAATNQDLDARSQQGTFRQDLYYRIHVVAIDLPPLRDRLDDIPLLVAHFLEEGVAGRGARDEENAECRMPNAESETNRQRPRSSGHSSFVIRHPSLATGRPPASVLSSPSPSPRRPDISQAALDVLMAHDWPGNVRELRNAIEHAVLLCRGDAILPEHLPRLLSRGQAGPGDDFRRAAAALLAQELSKSESVRGWESESVKNQTATEKAGAPTVYERLIAEFDRAIIAEALKLTGRNQARTAALLGLHRTTLRNKIHDLGLGAKE